MTYNNLSDTYKKLSDLKNTYQKVAELDNLSDDERKNLYNFYTSFDSIVPCCYVAISMDSKRMVSYSRSKEDAKRTAISRGVRKPLVVSKEYVKDQMDLSKLRHLDKIPKNIY